MKPLINQIVTASLNPLNYILISLFLSILLKEKYYKFKKFLISFSLFLLLISSTCFVPYRLAAYLENQFNTVQVNELNKLDNYNIIVLGGGLRYNLDRPSSIQLTQASQQRLVEGLRVLSHLPNASLITSGSQRLNTRSQAEIAKLAAIELGVNEDRIKILPLSWNTESEARDYVKEFGTNTPLILVTSATHMRRAVHWFKFYGVENITPAPTNYFTSKNAPIPWDKYLPHPDNISLFNKVIKELVGYAFSGA